MTEKKSAIKHIIDACFYSYSGIKSAYESEIAFRQDILICTALFIFALILPVPFIYKLVMIMSLFIILIAELINTAIEAVVDLVTEEYHPLAKVAKDTSAAAVLVFAIVAIIVGGYILYLKVEETLKPYKDLIKTTDKVNNGINSVKDLFKK